eukprot:5498934-Pyramimonas_sp.AAC.5
MSILPVPPRASAPQTCMTGRTGCLKCKMCCLHLDWGFGPELQNGQDDDEARARGGGGQRGQGEVLLAID